jgi:HYDIN/CFA65/VesB-like, Ig-like domain
MLVVASVPILARTAESGTSPPPTLAVTSTATCLGPGAVLTFTSPTDPAEFGWNTPVNGWQNFVTVLAGGTTSIGTLPLVSTGGPFPRFRVSGSLPLPAGRGGFFSWILRQTFVGPGGVFNQDSELAFFDNTKFTCDPNLAANTNCLPPGGGSLTFSGQVNRANEGNNRIDVGFDVDLSTAEVPFSKIIPNVGNTGADGTYNVTFTTPALSVGQHTFYVGSGSFDGPTFFWLPDDQSTNRNGTDKIVSVPITVPCPNAALSITPGARDFGGVNLGSTSAAAAFNVVNVGNIAAPINGVSVGGAQFGEFVVESNGCAAVTLPVGASCTVTMHFAPGGAGLRAATLTATSSNTATASASLTGTGVRPPGLSINPTNKNFGTVPERGASSATTFVVTNTGSAPQTITSVTLTGSQAAEFTVDPDTCGSAIVAGGATCTVKAAFTPTSSGSRTARLVVKSDANVTVQATLRGTGQPGQLGLDPNPADFGVVAVGTSSNAIAVTVTNGGSVALDVTAVRIGGTNAPEFLILSDTCTGQQLAPATACTVSVSFRPTDAGTRTGSLDIDQSDGTSSGVLTGVGIFQAILKFTPPVVSAGSLATVVGQSFPPNTAITLQWQETGIHEPLQVTTDGNGAFRLSFVIIIGERLGPRHLEPAPNPGVLVEPRPVAPLLVQAPTFRPQGVAIRSGGFNPSLVTRG